LDLKSFVATCLTATLVLTLSGFVYGWWLAYSRLQRALPILQYRRRLSPPWAVVDLLVAFLLLALGAVAASYLVAWIYGQAVDLPASERPPVQLATLIFANGVAVLTATFAAVIFVRLRTGCSWQDLGLDRRRLWADVKLGLLGFAMIVPPVYALQGFLAQFFEASHPLINVLKAADTDSQNVFLAAVSFAAVVVAPVCEEIQFRLLLQGLFERLAAKRESWSEVLFGKAETQPGSAVAENASHARTVSTRPAYAAIAGSALIFAAMHYSHGPAPVPLFFFALGLGYLYHQTHRILPSIIVHMLLNACTMLMLLHSLL